MIVGAIVAALGFGLSMGALMKSLHAFRDLVDFQFESNRDAWVAAGRPTGGVLTRPNLSFWQSDIAAVGCFQSWLMQAPEWVVPGTKAEQLRSRMARFFLVSLGGLVLVAAGLLWFAREVHAA